MNEEGKTNEVEVRTDYLQLTLTSDSKINTKLINNLGSEKILLLKQHEYENYFKNC